MTTGYVQKIRDWLNRCCGIHDQARLRLPGLCIELERCLPPSIAHEVTIVVPRAEIRKRCPVRDEKGNCRECEIEILLNSITLISAPRHPLAGEPPPAAPDRVQWNDKKKNPEA